MSSTHKQSGAVSLFVVIFAILLMSVVTIGFLRIMTGDQNKATGNDLAQSAYDSSQAGVEDAKRALLWYARNCNTTTPLSDCAVFLANLNECNAAIRTAQVVNSGDIAGTAGGSGTGEVKVQQSTSVDATGENTDKALDQAYTCVKLQLDTEDFIGNLTANQSALVPLIANNPVTSVTVQWFNRDDVTNTTGAVSLSAPVGRLPLESAWPANRPPVMRTQFMQAGGTFTLPGFDSTTASSESNANTVFLYPTSSSFSTTENIAVRDIRKNPAGDSVPASEGSAPLPVSCQPSVASGNYSCSMTLELPAPVGGGPAGIAYLRLTSLYTASHFRVTLNGALFRNVQPIVDSTGRANDVFRRVQSRIDLYDTAFPYPDAAIDTSGHLCKDFGVTDTQYVPGSATCTP